MRNRIRAIVMVSLFTALTAVGAFIKIPIPHVPLTLQTLMVMSAGLILGSRLGALSQLLYLTIGLIGLPIFAQGGGPGYVLQPSFGFLVGFIAGAFVIGKIIEKDESLSFSRTLAALLMGLPWLLAAPAPALGAFLADPSRGGTPGTALAWIGLCSPAAAAVALLLPARQAPALSPGNRGEDLAG